MTFKNYFENCKLHGFAPKHNVTEKDIDPVELRKGIKVEMEHTDDPDTAKKIAVDHLAEDGEYYKKLAKAKL